MITWRPSLPRQARQPAPTVVCPTAPGHNEDAVAVKIDTMIAAELVGLWDTRPYDYGSMESYSLALRADGSGWSTWQNAARAMSVGRFTWNCPEAGTLEIRYTATVSGSWELGRTGLATIDEQRPDDTVVLTRYTIDQDATPMVTEPFTALHLDRPIEFSRAYALVRRDIHSEDDPTPEINDA